MLICLDELADCCHGDLMLLRLERDSRLKCFCVCRVTRFQTRGPFPDDYPEGRKTEFSELPMKLNSNILNYKDIWLDFC